MLIGPGEHEQTERGVPRSVFAFASFAAGLALGRYAPGAPAPAWFAVACGALVVAAAARGRACATALVVAAVAFGGGWFTLRIHEPLAGGTAERLRAVEPGAPVRLEGVLLDTPRDVAEARDPLTPPLSGAAGTRATLSVRSIRTPSGWEPALGRVRVRAGDLSGAGLRAGDRVRVSGTLTPIAPPMNPGEADRRLHAAQEGTIGTVRVPAAALVERVEGPRGAAGEIESALLRWRAAAGERARALLLGDPGAPASEGRALLGALLLGEEDPALRAARPAFARLGLAHALAISGFHMAVMAAVALGLMRLTGDRGWVEPAFVALLVAVYLAILPVSAPVWRAGMMVLVLLAADAFGRRYDRIALLGWIAVGAVLWRPMDLWSIGFQLSFGLVATLMWLGASAHGRLWGVPIRTDRYVMEPSLRMLAWERTKQFISANVLCCVVAAPLVAYHTGTVSPAAVLTGLAVVPLITLLLYGGYGAVALGVLAPALSGPVSWGLERLASATVAVVRWLDEVPGTSFTIPPVSLAWAAAATGLALYWFARGYVRDRVAWAMTAIVAAWLGAEVVLGPRLPASMPLRIDTLAVGDGSCHLIRSGGEAMLWDCGSLTPGVGRTLVPRAVRALGGPAVRTVVVSHPDLDHFNALADAARDLGVRTVLVGEAFMADAGRADGPEAYLLERLRAQGVEARTLVAGDSFRLGHATVTVLSPPAGAAWPESNDRSLVAVFEVATEGGPRRLLMTGDIQGRAMEHLLSLRPAVAAEVMEAPHHGSAAAPSGEFIAAAGASVVLQSTGPRRADDPRLAGVRSSRAWWTTAVHGASWAEMGRDGSVRSGSFRGAGER